MEGKFKKATTNVLVGIISQVILLVLGIIVPRLILVNYGSEVNGLTSTVNQIYSYVALLEAGIGQSALFGLYKANNNNEKSSIIAGAQIQYLNTSKVFLLCLICLTVFLPLVLNSDLRYLDVALVVFFAGFPSLINFYLVSAYSQLLVVDGKSYIHNNFNLLFTTIGYIIKIVLANMAVHIVILQAAFCVISILKALSIYLYFKNNYKWIDTNAIPDKDSFKDRNAYVKTQIAWVVFSNTDVILISLICGLKSASVYAVYSMVFNALYAMMNQVYNGTSFLLGHIYHKSIKKYVALHDAFDCFFDMLVCATMSICGVLIIPFVKLYTAGITDINYIDNLLPILFCFDQILTWCRFSAGNLSSLAGYASKVGRISIIESIINLTCTILFVYLWGIRGALLGTIIALMFKSNYLLVFINKKILKRKYSTTYRILISNVVLYVLFQSTVTIYQITIASYIQFLEYGLIITCFIYSFFYLYNLVINKNETLYYTKLAIKKFKEYKLSK